MLEFAQQFPLTYWDMQLWLAVNALMALVGSELLGSILGKKSKIEKESLRIIGLALGLIFMIMVLALAYQTWTLIPP